MVIALTVVGVLSAADGPKPRVTTIQDREINRPNFPAAPGWVWRLHPQEFNPADFRAGKSFGQGGQDHLITGYAHLDADGNLRVFIVQSAPAVPHHDFPESRLVVLDAAGKRYLPGHPDATILNTMGNKETRAGHSIYALSRDVLPPEKVASIGIERLGPPMPPGVSVPAPRAR